jgi:hypothetical protein
MPGMSVLGGNRPSVHIRRTTADADKTASQQVSALTKQLAASGVDVSVGGQRGDQASRHSQRTTLKPIRGSCSHFS